MRLRPWLLVALLCVAFVDHGSFHRRRWQRGGWLLRLGRLTEIDHEGQLADRNDVILEKDRVALSDARSIYERAVLASEVANPESVIVEQKGTMMAADEFTARTQVAILFATNEKPCLINFDRAPAHRSAEYLYSSLHEAVVPRLASARQAVGDLDRN
jgi:hypothetical protein